MVLKTVKIPVFFIGKALEDSLSRSCSFSLMKQQKWEFYPKRRNRGPVSVSPCQHGGEPDDEELSLTTPYNSAEVIRPPCYTTRTRTVIIIMRASVCMEFSIRVTD